MAAVATGVFGEGLPWTMVYLGMGVAAAIIAGDLWLEAKGSEFRMPVLAVAVGIYLPLQLDTTIFLGGLIAWAAGRSFGKSRAKVQEPAARGRLDETEETGKRHGLLFAAGLITGEALVGIAMAIPIVVSGRAEVFAFWGVHEGTLPGLILLALVIYALYRVATPATNSLAQSA